jgi:hypothetical protein
MARREDGPGPARPIEAVPPPAAEKSDLGAAGEPARLVWPQEPLQSAPLPVAQAAGAGGGRSAAGGGRRWQPRVGHRRPGRGDRRPGGRPAPCTSSRSSGSPTAPPPRHSSTSAICPWPGPVRTWGRIGSASWPSGSKAWSRKSTPSGRPATNRPRVARKVYRVRTAVVLVAS